MFQKSALNTTSNVQMVGFWTKIAIAIVLMAMKVETVRMKYTLLRQYNGVWEKKNLLSS